MSAGSERPRQERRPGESGGPHHGGPEGDGGFWAAGAGRPGRPRPVKHPGTWPAALC